MTPKAKENVLITWRVVAISLLSVMSYLLIDIHNKVNQAHEFRIEQSTMNKAIQKEMDWISESHRKMDLKLDKITEKQYLLESKVFKGRSGGS